MKSNKKQMINYVNKVIKEFTKKGLNVDFITQGKSIDKIAHNKKTFEIFKKLVKRGRELPKIIKENKQYDAKFEKKKQQKEAKKEVEKVVKKRRTRTLTPQEQNRGFISNETKNFLKYNFKNTKATKLHAKLKVVDEANKFLNRYFKSVKDHDDVKKRIDKITNRLGSRLDKLYDMIDEFATYEYKYKQDKGFMKNNMTDEYEKGLKERLNDLEDILDTYGL